MPSPVDIRISYMLEGWWVSTIADLASDPGYPFNFDAGAAVEVVVAEIFTVNKWTVAKVC